MTFFLVLIVYFLLLLIAVVFMFAIAPILNYFIDKWVDWLETKGIK